MKIKKLLRYSYIVGFLLTSFSLSAKDSETLTSLQNENRTLSGSFDLHLSDANNPLVNSTVAIVSEEAWLFFDNMKPSKVLDNYANAITINGAAIEPFVNCRLVVYRQGAVVIPHPAAYQPLETFTGLDFGGTSRQYMVDQYYSNSPVSDIPSARREALTDDNSIRSIKLKRGYMATLANEPDGMGYSRCFIADKEDLEINLPAELDGKISFIRVFSWEWVSKKGWCGGQWTSQINGWKWGWEQSDHTNSTWFYDWGARLNQSGTSVTTLLNQEYVPEKWGKGGSIGVFYENKRWSHLIGQNEPDHSEQSNMTVEEAIAEWPVLMKTGARLGSPATTDFNWLYRFMAECEARNYRVDFVVVHAYWGGKSPSSWYNDLKKIHDTTGRPIWIKEWNNGANWTNEGGWTSDHAYNTQNAQKQLNDLKGILQVMDTASFVERYSIYNWVQDCRAIILNSQLTTAGEYYASTTPDFAFNRNKEVIPKWTMTAPKLSYYFNTAAGTVNLSWTDFNGELTSQYIIEQSMDKQNWEKMGEVNSPYIKEFALAALSSDDVPGGEVFYRIKTVGYDGVGKTSNIIKYDFLKNKADALLVATDVKVKEDWSMYLFENEQDGEQVFLAGPPTYRNRSPLVVRARNTNGKSFELQLRTYDYLENPTFVNPDTLSILSIPKGRYVWGDVTLLTDTVHNISKAWRTITFTTPFEVVPVVFATQITGNDNTASALRIRNITKTGFDVCRKYEAGKPNVLEDIAFIAATPGTGYYDGVNRIEVGITPEAQGISYSSTAKINYANEYQNPAFFAFMQTCNDETAANLRIKTRNGKSVEVFKEKEKSTSSTNPAAEIIGWMVLGANNATGINELLSGKNNPIIFDTHTNTIHLSDFGIMERASVYSLLGAKLIVVSKATVIDVSSLPTGVYIVKSGGSKYLKFIKQ